MLSVNSNCDPDYTRNAIGKREGDYYRGGIEPEGRWYMPVNPWGLEDGAVIDNKVYDALRDGLDPLTKSVIGRPPKDPTKKRARAHDMTFSAPKSVSILWALLPEVRSRIGDFQERAVRRALQMLGDHAAFVGRGNSREDIQKTHVLGATFQHGDARPIEKRNGLDGGDMQLHTHFVWFNLGQDDRGEWYAVDLRHTYQWQKALGAAYRAELAHLMETELGCRIRLREHGMFEIEGIPKDMRAAWSGRRKQIESLMEQFGLTTGESPELAALIAAVSRRAKLVGEQGETYEGRFERWLEEMQAMGMTTDSLLVALDNPFTDAELLAREAEFDEAMADMALKTTETQGVIALDDLYEYIGGLCVGFGRSADDIETLAQSLIDPTPLPENLMAWDDEAFDRLIDAKVAAGKLVALPRLTDLAGRPLYTAPDLIRAERGISKLCGNSAADSRHQIHTADVETYLKELHRLAALPPAPGEVPVLAPTEEQENGIRYVTTRPGLVVSLEGAAGSGKSVTLKHITALYRTVMGPALGVDYRVIGCSAKWLTAKAMIKDADLSDADTRAAAKWIADIRSGKEKIDERTVMLVDEAGQTGSRDLYNLLQPFIAAGAKIILTGDRSQQRSVGAGPALDIVASRVGTLRLERTQRMRAQPDDILVHRDGLSREEAIIRVHGLSSEQRRILVRGAGAVVKDEIRARFADPHYALTPEDILIWAFDMPPLEAVREAAALQARSDKDVARLVRREGAAAREVALAWAKDPKSTATLQQVFHYLHDQNWVVAEKRANLLSPEAAERLLNGHASATRAAILAWADDPTARPTLADRYVWLDRLDRRTAEAKAAEERPAGSAAADAPSVALSDSDIAAIKAAARKYAKATSPLPKAEDVLHWVHGLTWTEAIRRVDGMSPSERSAVMTASTAQELGSAEQSTLQRAHAWATMPEQMMTASDVLVHVFGLDRATAAERSASLTEEQRHRLIVRHHAEVAASGQIWARQAATDLSHAGETPQRAFRALRAFQDHGRLRWLQTHDDALAAAVDDWKAYMAANAADKAGTPLDWRKSRTMAVVLAKSNTDVRALNLMMRDHLRQTGQIAESDHVIQTQARQRQGTRHLDIDLPVSVGEQLLFTKRDDHLKVVNGTIGRVIAMAPSPHAGHAVLTVALAAGEDNGGEERTITFDTASYANPKTGRAFLEHSYAVTNFSAQGMTRAVCFAQVDSSMKMNAAYVAISRARALTVLYASRRAEDAYLAGNLPLTERRDAIFSDRDRLRALAHALARAQHQPSILDAFDPEWRDRIKEGSIRAEGHYDERDLEWRALSDDEVAVAIQSIVNPHADPLPEAPDWVPVEPDSAMPPDGWDEAIAPTAPPVPQPLDAAFQALKIDPAALAPSAFSSASIRRLPLTKSPLPSPIAHASVPSVKNDIGDDLKTTEAAPRALMHSVTPEVPRTLPPPLLDTPITHTSLPIVLTQHWSPPAAVALAPLPPIAASTHINNPSPPFRNWQPASAGLNSSPLERGSLSSARRRVSPTRVAAHLLSTVRTGEIMPRDDNTAIAPRRRNFRAYSPVRDERRREADDLLANEMKEILSGGVDFRDVLMEAGWRPARANDPGKWCYWTNGSTAKLDPDNTISIRRFEDGWGWKTKDGSHSGNMISWGREFAGWPAKGVKGGWRETWLHLRTHLPGAPLLDHNGTPPSVSHADRERAKQQMDERREAERLRNEAARREEVKDTHARAQAYWPTLATVSSTSIGNILDRRGISRATQTRYSATIRFDPRGTFVAFKHVTADGTITGAERKGPDFNRFTVGSGGKSLALFGDPTAALTRIVVTETGVDALSRAQRDGCPTDVLYVSTGGNSSMKLDEDWGSHFAAEHLVALAKRHPNAIIDLATDRDRGGNEQATGWAGLLVGHPAGLVRSTPPSTNDWNNEIRLPNPALLTVAAYHKDLRKAAPPLPPPPAQRSDLLPHWQAYEVARPILPSVLETLARGVGAWMEVPAGIDQRHWRDAPLARILWDEIRDGISADANLSVAIATAVTEILPRWHAWYAQEGAFNRLAAALKREMAGAPDSDRIDQARFTKSGAGVYLKAIQTAIMEQGLPLDRAIDAAVAGVAAEDGEAIKTARSGRGEPPPDRTAARDVLLRMRNHIANNPETYALAPAAVDLYPALAGLAKIAAEFAASPPPLPNPAGWVPSEPNHDPVAEALAQAAAKAAAAAAPAAEAAQSSRPFAHETSDVATMAEAPPVFSAEPSPSSRAGSDPRQVDSDASPIDIDTMFAATADDPIPQERGHDEGAFIPPIDDDDRPPTEEEIAADLARRAALALPVTEILLPADEDTLDDAGQPADEKDAIMDSLTSPAPSAPEVLAEEQREAARAAAQDAAAQTEEDRARTESAARRLRAENIRNQQEGISATEVVRPRRQADGKPGRDDPDSDRAPGNPSRAGTLGEEFGVDNSPEKQRQNFLKLLGEFYETHFSAKHEQDLAHVRIRPGKHADEVMIEFRDGSRLRDDGRKIMLDSKGTPQKAELLIEIAAGKGMNPLRLKGSYEFKRDLAMACFEHGIEVLNPELRSYMAHLAERFPERAGIHAKDPDRPALQDAPSPAAERAVPPPPPPPVAEQTVPTEPVPAPTPTIPAAPEPLISETAALAPPAAEPVVTDDLARALIELTAARVARAETALQALSPDNADRAAVAAAITEVSVAKDDLANAHRLAAIRAGTTTVPDPVIASDDAMRVWIDAERMRPFAAARQSAPSAPTAVSLPSSTADAQISVTTTGKTEPATGAPDALIEPPMLQPVHPPATPPAPTSILDIAAISALTRSFLAASAVLSDANAGEAALSPADRATYLEAALAAGQQLSGQLDAVRAHDPEFAAALATFQNRRAALEVAGADLESQALARLYEDPSHARIAIETALAEDGVNVVAARFSQSPESFGPLRDDLDLSVPLDHIALDLRGYGLAAEEVEGMKSGLRLASDGSSPNTDRSIAVDIEAHLHEAPLLSELQHELDAARATASTVAAITGESEFVAAMPTDPTAAEIHRLASAYAASSSRAARALLAARLLSHVADCEPTIRALEGRDNPVLTRTGHDVRQAQERITLATDAIHHQVAAVFADPPAVLAALSATPDPVKAGWATNPPVLAALGVLHAVSEISTPDGSVPSQEAAQFSQSLQALGSAVRDHAEASDAASRALAAIPNASAAQEIRTAIRDAIPWTSLPSAPGIDPMTVANVANDVTNLDTAVALLAHAAHPVNQGLTTDLAAADTTLAASDRQALVNWLRLSDEQTTAADALLAAQPPTATPEQRFAALTASESFLLDAQISALFDDVGDADNRAYRLSVEDMLVTAQHCARSAAELIQSDPASLHYALSQGAEVSLRTHLAPVPTAAVQAVDHTHEEEFGPEMG